MICLRYSLIIMPDMTRYAGDGAGIKAITGGDRVSIDPKHKAPYSIRIPAVVLAVNNNAMTFSERIVTNTEQLDALLEHLEKFRAQLSAPPRWMSEK